MKLSNFRRIVGEDYPKENSKLVEQLGYSINNFADEVINLANKNINDDNLLQNKVTVLLTVDSTGTPTSQISFQTGINLVSKGCVVIKATNQTSSSVFPTACPFITYTETNNLIKIINVSGLQANNKYSLVIEVKG